MKYEDRGKTIEENLKIMWDEYVDAQNPTVGKNWLSWPKEIYMTKEQLEEYKKEAVGKPLGGVWRYRGVPIIVL